MNFRISLSIHIEMALDILGDWFEFVGQFREYCHVHKEYPIYKSDMFFHYFRSSLISIIFCSFQCTSKLYTSFTKFILKYFILCDTISNAVVSYSSSDYTLLVYSDELIFIYGLVSYNLTNSFINHFTFVCLFPRIFYT